MSHFTFLIPRSLFESRFYLDVSVGDKVAVVVIRLLHVCLILAVDLLGTCIVKCTILHCLMTEELRRSLV